MNPSPSSVLFTITVVRYEENNHSSDPTVHTALNIMNFFCAKDPFVKWTFIIFNYEARDMAVTRRQRFEDVVEARK